MRDIHPRRSRGGGNVGIAAAISKAGGRVGKQFYRFPTLPTDRHFHGRGPQRTISARWGGTASTVHHTTSSALFAPFQRASEAERLCSGLDDVGPVRDPVQQRFAEPRIRKHGRPFGER